MKTQLMIRCDFTATNIKL